jgi:acetone carboxylase, gamma subunit
MTGRNDFEVTPAHVGLLADGKLPPEDLKRLMKLQPKDAARFAHYIEHLRRTVPLDEPILMRISEHLYIVETAAGQRVVKCDCGHAFGDYQTNWKLGTLIRVRETTADMARVYYPIEAVPEEGWLEIREFYCPGCASQLAVECVAPGYPVVFEFLPDVDAFYREWVDLPIASEARELRDRTEAVTQSWASAAR